MPSLFFADNASQQTLNVIIFNFNDDAGFDDDDVTDAGATALTGAGAGITTDADGLAGAGITTGAGGAGAGGSLAGAGGDTDGDITGVITAGAGADGFADGGTGCAGVRTDGAVDVTCPDVSTGTGAGAGGCAGLVCFTYGVGTL